LEVIDHLPKSDGDKNHQHYFCFLSWLAADNEIEYIEYAVQVWPGFSSELFESYQKEKGKTFILFFYKKLLICS
jgi:hypothetical protein